MEDITQHTLHTLAGDHPPQVTSMVSDGVTPLSHEDQPTISTKLDTTITSDNKMVNSVQVDDTPDSTDKKEKQDSTFEENKGGSTAKEEKQDPTFKGEEEVFIAIGGNEDSASNDNKQSSTSSKDKNEDTTSKGEKDRSISSSKSKKQGSTTKEKKVGSVPKTKKQGLASKEKKQSSASKEKKEGSTPKEKKQGPAAKEKKENAASRAKKDSKGKKQNADSKGKKQDSASKEKKQDLASTEKKQAKQKNLKDTTKQQRKRSRTVAFSSEDHDNIEHNNDEVGLKKKKQKTEQSQTDTVPQSEVVTPKQPMQEEKNIVTESANDDKESDNKEGPSHEGNNQDTPKMDSGMLEGSSLATAAEVKENASSGGESGSEWEDHKETLCGQRMKKGAVQCPICGRRFTSMSRLYQFHYTEGSQTCPGPRRKITPRPTMKGKYPCPSCGKVFTSLARLNQYHYNKTTQTCGDIITPVATCYSDGVNAALGSEKITEQELYASISKDAPVGERNAVWRRILKQCKVLRCQNDECDYKATRIASMVYHYERCGKEVILACSECDKTYTTKAGLDYHFKRAHRSPADVTKPTVELPLKRQAAIRASDNLANINKTSPEEIQATTDEVKPEVDTSLESPASFDVDELSEVAFREAKENLKKGLVVTCPIEHCDLTFKSASGLKYHLKRCTGQKKFKCKVCHKTISTLVRYQNHMAKKHHIGEQSCEDGDYIIPENVTVQSSDEEDHVRKTKSTTKSVTDVWTNLHAVYQSELKNILAEMMSGEELFTDWQPSVVAWERCDPKECVHYAPQSMKYRFVNGDGVSSSVSQLALFDAALDDITTGATLNVGGPVWSMGWAPIGDDSSTQYVAMAVYQTMDETYQLDIPLRHNGGIQLWSMLLGDQPSLPRLSLVIGHQYGCVRSMKWCPSGCATKPTISCNSQRLARLGLLALACSDGVVRILSVPYPELLLEQLGPEDSTVTNFDLFVTPKSICCLLSPSNITVQSDFSLVYGQCHDVEWLPRQPHNKIAASFSNGSVVIWDLLTNSWLLRGSHDHCNNVIYPQLHIKAHATICRSLSWCPDDTDYLFTAGYDVRRCLWDLKYPYEPAEKWDRIGQGMYFDSIWPLLCPGVLYLEDTVSGLGTSGMYYHDFQASSEIAISGRPHILTFSYCHWKNRLAFGTITGDLVLRGFPPFINSFKPANFNKKLDVTKYRTTTGRYNYYLYFFIATPCDTDDDITTNDDDDITTNYDDITMEQLSHHKCLVFHNYPKDSKHQLEFKSDMIPLSAVTKVSWNPHQQHCDWLLAATNTGLVRLLKWSRDSS